MNKIMVAAVLGGTFYSAPSSAYSYWDIINGVSINQAICRDYHICKPTDLGYVDYTRPDASFKASTVYGVAPLSVTFTNGSYAGSNGYVQNKLSYAWDFGDGSTDTSKNPTHTYVNGGTYTVTLIASDPRNTSSKPYTMQISVTSPKIIAQSEADANRKQLLSKYVFDVNYYLAGNPDLAKIYNGDRAAATEHWVNTGFYEMRRGSPYFALSAYIFNNPDLTKQFDTFYELYLNHFLSNGIYEGRVSSIFYDGVEYLYLNSDLRRAFGSDYQAALDHYIKYGIFEGRQASKWFSAKEYFRVNSDLQSVYKSDYYAALMHYALYGVNEGRSLGNVAQKPSTGGTPFTNAMTGTWHSPELPGRRFNVTQDGYLLKVCQVDYSCSTGMTGRMDVKHNVILIGLPTIYGPQMQFTIKFDSPSHGILVLDYCTKVGNGYECDANDFSVGARFNVYKM